MESLSRRTSLISERIKSMNQKFYMQEEVSFKNKGKKMFSDKRKLRDFVTRAPYCKNVKEVF